MGTPKVTYFSILKYGDDPIFLFQHFQLANVKLLARGTVKHVATFAAREVAGRVEVGQHICVTEDDVEIYAFRHSCGLVAICICKKGYPGRVAFSLLEAALVAFIREYPDGGIEHTVDVNLSAPGVKALVEKYKDPAVVDACTAVSGKLAQTLNIVHKTVAELLQNGETLEALTFLQRVENSNIKRAAGSCKMFGGGGCPYEYMQRRSAGVAQHLKVTSGAFGNVGGSSGGGAACGIFQSCRFYIDGLITLVDASDGQSGNFTATAARARAGREKGGGAEATATTFATSATTTTSPIGTSALQLESAASYRNSPKNASTMDAHAKLVSMIYSMGGEVEISLLGHVTHHIVEWVALGCTKWWRLRMGIKSKGPFICTPQYIYDCCKAGCRLKEADYLPQCLVPKASNGGIQKYLSKSRLSLLGRWKSMVASRFDVEPLVAHYDDVLSGNVQLVYIDMDAFFVSVALLDYPHLKGLPVAVAYGSGQDSASEICTCSYEARKFGICKGMWVAKALQQCPQLEMIKYNLDKITQAAYSAIEAAIGVVGPRVKVISCDEFVVALDGSEVAASGAADLVQNGPGLPCKGVRVQNGALENSRESGGPWDGSGALDDNAASKGCYPHPDTTTATTHSTILVRLHEAIVKATKCPCSLGLGRSILQAKLAANVCKAIKYQDATLPDGCSVFQSASSPTCVSMDSVKVFMSQLPLDKLPRLQENAIQVLYQEGLVYCGDVITKVTFEQLESRIGKTMATNLDTWCRGLDLPSEYSDVSSVLKPRSVSTRANYGIRFTTDDDVCQVLEELVNECFQRIEPLVRAHSFTHVRVSLQVAIKAQDAPMEPKKYLGCGLCDRWSTCIGTMTLEDRAAICEALFEAHQQILKLHDKPLEHVRGLALVFAPIYNVESNTTRNGINTNSSSKSRNRQDATRSPAKRTRVYIPPSERGSILQHLVVTSPSPRRSLTLTGSKTASTNGFSPHTNIRLNGGDAAMTKERSRSANVLYKSHAAHTKVIDKLFAELIKLTWPSSLDVNRQVAKLVQWSLKDSGLHQQKHKQVELINQRIAYWIKLAQGMGRMDLVESLDCIQRQQLL